MGTLERLRGGELGKSEGGGVKKIRRFAPKPQNFGGKPFFLKKSRFLPKTPKSHLVSGLRPDFLGKETPTPERPEVARVWVLLRFIYHKYHNLSQISQFITIKMIRLNRRGNHFKSLF